MSYGESSSPSPVQLLTAAGEEEGREGERAMREGVRREERRRGVRGRAGRKRKGWIEEETEDTVMRLQLMFLPPPRIKIIERASI